MHIPRQIRSALERLLPSYALDYLTEKFVEYEKMCTEAESIKQENQFLHQQIHKMLGNFMQQQYPMGYSQHSMGPTNHYPEWEYPYERRNSRYEFDMRRGVPGSRMRNVGGESGGSGGGAGGSANTTSVNEFRNESESPYRRHLPIHENTVPLREEEP